VHQRRVQRDRVCHPAEPLGRDDDAAKTTRQTDHIRLALPHAQYLPKRREHPRRIARPVPARLSAGHGRIGQGRWPLNAYLGRLAVMSAAPE
jgi:hypothetical protein